MKKLSVFITVVLCCVFASAQSPCPTTATIDGVAYDVVQVGSQCWTASNMRNMHYSDGADVVPIPMLFNTSSYPSVDATRYGYLYTPAAATRTWSVVDNEIQGVCPEGWHIPTRADLLALLAEVSVEQLMASEDWLPRDGSNTLGFNLLPAGIYNDTDSLFENYLITTELLTAETSGTKVYHPCKFGSMCGTWEFIPGKDGNGYSVRCVRDAETLPVITDTIAFLPNGGQGTMDTMFVTRGDTVLNANTYTHDGNWEFLGWNTEANGAGTHYDNYATITTNGNVTLYAQWHTYCTGTPSDNEVGNARIDSLKDVDNNKYAVVQIGNQCWMKQNLRTLTNDADTGHIYTPTTTGYDVETYGRLYDWAAVMQGESSTNYPDSGNVVRGICPEGWHVPSSNEWDTLTTYVNSVTEYRCGGTDKAIAKSLAATMGWDPNDNACRIGNLLSHNNATGFSALPAGNIISNNPQSHNGFGISTLFASATVGSSDTNYCAELLNSLTPRVGIKYNTQSVECISVRCVRNVMPIVTTDSANTVTNNSAKLYGNVTSMGKYTEVNAGFKYGTSESTLTSIASDESAMHATGLFSYTITDLTANTQYYFKAFAANGTDTVYGEVKNFTTTGSSTFTCGTDSVKDVDNNWYHTVKIGNQCWMKENLRTKTSAYGNVWTTKPDADSTIYGRYYDWAAVMQGKSTTNYPVSGDKVRGICPEGWHVPSDAEWDTLTYYVYNSAYPDYKCSGCESSVWEQSTKCIANALSSPTGWNNSSTSGCNAGDYSTTRNLTGFSAVPAGYNAGDYYYFRSYAFFWSATQDGDDVAWCRILSSGSSCVFGSNFNKDFSFSVRCLKDAEVPAAMSVTTDSANTVTKNGAKLYGTVASLGDNEQVTAGFRYGQHPDYMTFKAENTASATGSYNAELTGISPNTTYYFQAYAATATDTAYAADTLTFTTLTVPCSVNALRAGTPLDGDKHANKEYGADSKIDSVSDHEGNVYRVVEINGQCWLAENMRCTTSPRNNLQPGSSTDYNNPKYYDDNSTALKVTNLRARGLLYNWVAAMDSVFTSQPGEVDFPKRRGICPEGWHLPTDDELFMLEKNVLTNASWASVTSASNSGKGWRGTGAGKLTGGCVWSSSTNTTAPGNYSYADRNNTGFSALPVGFYDGSFTNSGANALFWSATSYDTYNAWGRSFYYDSEGVSRYYNDKGYGLSVRCVRDAEAPAAMSVTTDSANTVTKNGAKLYGTVASLGDNEQVTAGFRYGQHPDYMTFKAENTASATGSYNAELTGISPNTTYYFQAYAATANDTAWAADTLTFTTLTVPCSVNALRAGTPLVGDKHANKEYGADSKIDSVSDHEGNVYRVVEINGQCWLAENMRCTTSPRNNLQSGGTSGTDNNNPKYYDYNSTAQVVTNSRARGMLYNWAGAMDSVFTSQPGAVDFPNRRGICPEGWHLPTDDEWFMLEKNVLTNAAWASVTSASNSGKGWRGTGAGKLTGGCVWSSSNKTTAPGNYSYADRNNTGFSALPVGFYDGSFTNSGANALFWSATSYDTYNAWGRSFYYDSEGVSRYYNDKNYGLSVRCLRDPEAPAAMSVTTDSAASVTSSSATLYGTVVYLGDNEQVTAGFRYGQHPDYMTFKAENTASATGSYNAELTGISPNTTYYFQAYAATANDTAWAADTLTFTTLTIPCSVNALRAGTPLDGGKHANKEYGADSKIDSVSDHEGNVYRVVEINGQCWLAENMRCTTSPRNNLQPGSSTDYNNPKYYDYNSTGQVVTNSRARGLLYNWAGAMDSVFTSQPGEVDFPNRRGICPEGWHLPTDDEWFRLEKNVLTNADWASVTSASGSGTGYRGTGAGKLTGGCVWSSSSNTTTPNSYSYADRNNTGFSALPVGYYYSGSFRSSGTNAGFWSATSYNTSSAQYRYFYNDGEGVYRNDTGKSNGFSVRCVRD